LAKILEGKGSEVWVLTRAS